MSEQRLINIKCISKTGLPVEFKVREILEIDGQPLRPEQQTLLTTILNRLDAIEQHVGLTAGDSHA
jgi:hypothetical protein